MGRRIGVIGVVLAALVVGLLVPATASAIRLAPVAGGFDDLTQVTAPRRGDTAGVLYVVEQEGQIFRRRSGSNSLFLDIRGRVDFGGERGLLSMAFDPAYGTNRLFYVYYTDNNGNIRVARFRANAASTGTIPGSGKIILRVGHPGASNHNGGQLAFAANGRLYAATGDGGGGCDSEGPNAQNLRSRLGKLLSVNPRNLGAGWRIEGYGLRNPWRFSFDRANGRLYIGDVGQGSQEEVDTRRAGLLGGKRENYGWNVYEGRLFNPCGNKRLNRTGPLVRPVSVYSHAAGRCSITGGVVYRGRAINWLRGSYVFADYCTGEIWRIRVNSDGRRVVGRRLLRDAPFNVTSFGEGVRGALYVVDQSGSIYRLAT
jgi:glucose/arabinose dehydrogenase